MSGLQVRTDSVGREMSIVQVLPLVAGFSAADFLRAIALYALLDFAHTLQPVVEPLRQPAISEFQ
jgi:hypothetical protein